MHAITADNLKQFYPTYSGYAHRRAETASMIGVESSVDLKDFRASIHDLNEKSGLGLTEQEANIVALMLTEEEANIRFNGNKFIHPNLGGNTGEHPIFLSHKIDMIRDNAGYGPSRFSDLDPKLQLSAAQFYQRQHIKSLLHDGGELIDIAYSEQKATGASFKEPEEEALVGPFKIELAAFAISARKPALYVSKMHIARERIKKVKQELYDQAMRGEITGDEFVIGVGHEIGRIIGEIKGDLAAEHNNLRDAMRPEYRNAATSLTQVFESTQTKGDVHQAIFDMFDKLEGDAHFRHFIGRNVVAPDAHTPLMERAFNGGKALSYHLASSKDVIDAITYSQKTIPLALKLAAEMPKGVEREIALSTARQGAAYILRNYIRILQKSPPLIDVSKADDQSAKLTSDPEAQPEQFTARLAKQRELSSQWQAKRQENGSAHYPITAIEGTVDTKTLIAVFDKAATAIENGSYIPTSLPIGLGPLPAQLHVSAQDVTRCSKTYPLEVSTHYNEHQVAI